MTNSLHGLYHEFELKLSIGTILPMIYIYILIHQ